MENAVIFSHTKDEIKIRYNYILKIILNVKNLKTQPLDIMFSFAKELKRNSWRSLHTHMVIAVLFTCTKMCDLYGILEWTITQPWKGSSHILSSRAGPENAILCKFKSITNFQLPGPVLKKIMMDAYIPSGESGRGPSRELFNGRRFQFGWWKVF